MLIERFALLQEIISFVFVHVEPAVARRLRWRCIQDECVPYLF